MAEEVPNGLMVIKLENQKIPEFKQVKGKDWIYWGEENNYPDYLIGLFMRSSTHNAIVTGKVNYILGNGWTANKKGLSVNEQAKLNDFLRKINEYETLNELSEKVFLDFELFNAVALEVIWDKGKRNFTLNHLPINKLRTNEDESKYYYSKDWTERTQSEEKTGLKEFNPFDFDKKENGVFIYQITAPRTGKDPNVYSIPEYIGSTQAIETDAECSNYNLSEIKTGFSAGTILNFFNGIPTDEAKKKIEKQISAKFSGTDRAGSFILNFSDGKDRGSEVVSLNGNDLDKRYVELKKDVRQEIFTGHKVSSPMLFGVKTEGQLGGRTEIGEAFELFQNTYISRRQRILEKIFNKFAMLKGLHGNLELKPASAINTNVFTEQTIVASLPAKAIQELIAERMGIDLTRYENVPVVTTTQNTQMKSQEIEGKLLEAFASIGRPKSEFHIYKRRELFNTDTFSIAKEEQEYFKSELTAKERAIIDLLNKDEKMPSSEIAKTLNISESDVEIQISSLVEREYLNPSTSGYSPSSEALDITDEEGSKTHNIEILYSYEERKNAPKLKGESRPFCKERIKQDKFYTRAEIDSLSNGMGLDVWTFKGGWYTNPNTDAPTPQCRHIWVQNVVKRK